MTTNRSAFAQFYDDVISHGRMDVADSVLAPDVMHHSAFPGQAPGAEGVKASVAMLRAGFADFRMTAHDIVEEGDRVVGRFTVTGRHVADSMGVAATGVSFQFDEIMIVRVDHGRIAELWSVVDRLSLLQQLGVIAA